MNKQQFIDVLREPQKATEETVTELEAVVKEYPYFQSARIVLAKGSKLLKDPKTSQRISLAAVYSTDRLLLKKYINDKLIFLDVSKPKPGEEAKIDKVKVAPPQVSAKKPPPKVAPPKVEKVVDKKQKVEDRPSKPKVQTAKHDEPPQAKQGRNKIPPLNLPQSDFNPEEIIDEIKSELEEYKKNKQQFEDYIQQAEERSAVEAALKKVESAQQDETVEESPAKEEIEAKTEEHPEPTSEVTAPEKVEPKVENIEDAAIRALPQLGTKEDPKPKSSGYADKILIVGSNKAPKIDPQNSEVEAPKPEKPKKAVTKVKAEEIKEKPTAEESEKEKAVSSDESVEVENVKEGEKTTPKAETEKPVEKVDINTDEDFEDEMSSKSEDSDTTTDDILSSIDEEISADKAEVTPQAEQVEEQPVLEEPQVEEPVAEEPAAEKAVAEEPVEEKPKADAPDEDTPKNIDKTEKDSQEEQPLLDESKLIQREEQIEIDKIDRKKAGKLRKEKLRRLREQRGIIIDDEKEEEETNGKEEQPEVSTEPESSPEASKPEVEDSVSEKVDKKKETKEKPESKSDPDATEKATSDSKTEPPKEDLEVKKSKKKQEQRDIIDEFIDAAPQISSKKPSQDADKEKKDLSAKSQEVDDNMISENLAIIYKNQGKTKKAIEIYEKLILKFPEKEAYFATRIEDLKKS